jgi:5-methylcytosine-specific restriction endonuclease McrA
MSERLKGHLTSEETKEKIRLSKIGKKRPDMIGHKWNVGRKLTEEHKRKIREAESGKKHYNWQGGISFEPYTLDWTKILKKSIRERDKYTCQICKKKQIDKEFSVHHIDYDKQNCNPDNLITLCRSCHAKTSHNRNNWIKYFKK